MSTNDMMRDNSKSLFFTVMEAEGDELQPFDGGDAQVADTPAEDIAPPATDTSGGGDDLGDPPPLNEDDGGMDMPAFGEDDAGGDDMGGGDSSSNEDEEADKQDTKLSDKANNILNEQLYKKMVARNSEIEEILASLKDLVPLLPYDVVKSNDESVNHLKNALTKGQKYVINDFVDSGYGENQLFYQKLDSLYTLLLNRIDTNLKKIKDKQ